MDTIFNFPIELWLFQILIILFPILLFFFFTWKKFKAMKQVEIFDAIEIEKMHLIGQLSTSIAYEMEKPLNKVNHLLEGLYNQNELSNHTKRKVEETVADLEKAQRVVHDYIELAEIPDKNHYLLDVRKELDAVVNAIYSLANLHNIEVKYFSTLEKDIYIIGNRFQFRQALINLIKNGMEASQKNGSIEIAIHEMLASVLIVIEDSGDGMTKEQLKCLGHPLPTTKESGTGLGIMVSYNIIRSMRGKVEVVSEQGKGTVFSIILPKAIGVNL